MTAQRDLPVGAVAPDITAIEPTSDTIHGRFTSLVRLLDPSYGPALYPILGGSENAWRWTYMLKAGATTPEEFQENLESYMQTKCYMVMSGPESDAKPLGMLSYISIVPEMRRLEIGSVIFGEQLVRTKIATEAFYVMIKHAIETLGYQRVEWKCNNLNKPSLAAAKRLGFSFEGIFRKHMIIQGRLRDSAYFAITDDDWPVVKQAFEAWLDDANFDADGQQKRSLQDIRSELEPQT